MNDEIMNNTEVMETVEETINKEPNKLAKYGLIGAVVVAAGAVIATIVIKKVKAKKEKRIGESVNIKDDEFEVDENDD